MAQTHITPAIRLLSAAEVSKRTTLSRTTIWRAVRAKTFPPAVTISPSRVAWFADEVEAWLLAKRSSRSIFAAA